MARVYKGSATGRPEAVCSKCRNESRQRRQQTLVIILTELRSADPTGDMCLICKPFIGCNHGEVTPEQAWDRRHGVLSQNSDDMNADIKGCTNVQFRNQVLILNLCFYSDWLQRFETRRVLISLDTSLERNRRRVQFRWKHIILHHHQCQAWNVEIVGILK